MLLTVYRGPQASVMLRTSQTIFIHQIELVLVQYIEFLKQADMDGITKDEMDRFRRQHVAIQAVVEVRYHRPDSYSVLPGSYSVLSGSDSGHWLLLYFPWLSL